MRIFIFNQRRMRDESTNDRWSATMIIPQPNYFTNPEFLKGYEEGYEAAKVDMDRLLKSMITLQTCTSTSSICTHKHPDGREAWVTGAGYKVNDTSFWHPIKCGICGQEK
jgi:hypothetical protein